MDNLQNGGNTPNIEYGVPANEQPQAAPQTDNPLDALLSQPSTPVQPQPAPAPQAPVKEKKKKGKLFVGLGIGAAIIAIITVVLALIIGGVILFFVLSKPTVSMNEYADVEFVGYNEIGLAEYGIDKLTFVAENEKNFKFTSKFKKEIDSTDNIYLQNANFGYDYDNPMDGDAAAFFYDVVTSNLYMTETTDLCNGDTVTWCWGIDFESEDGKELASLLGVKIEASDIPYTVEGLEVVPLFDPFETFNITFEGIAPDAYVDYDWYNGETGISYSVSPEDGLKNGDVVTVTASYSDWMTLNDYAEMYGQIPSVLEKTYTVSGLQTYVTSADEIPEEAFLAMDSQAKNVINASLAGAEDIQNIQITRVGNYFLDSKSGDSWKRNQIKVVYKVHFDRNYENYQGEVQNFAIDYYYVVGWDNLLLNEDGTCSFDVYDYDEPYNRFEVDTGIIQSVYKYLGTYTTYAMRLYGFATVDDIYSVVIQDQIADYDVYENIDESLLAPSVPIGAEEGGEGDGEL